MATKRVCLFPVLHKEAAQGGRVPFETVSYPDPNQGNLIQLEGDFPTRESSESTSSQSDWFRIGRRAPLVTFRDFSKSH